MALNGNETLQVLGQDGTGAPAATTFQTTTAAIAALAASGSTNTVITTLSTVGAGTLTAAAITGKIITRSGAQSGTPFTDTTDTAVAIIAALPSSAQIVGDAFAMTYQNLTNAVATIIGGTGVTVSGDVTIPANGYARYLMTIGASSTITMVQYENGGFSADATDPTKIIAFKPSGQTTATTALIATSNTANATYTLPPSTGSIAATTGTNLFVADVKRTSAAVTKNASIVYANVTGLSFTVVPGTYAFRLELPSTVASGTAGIKYAFNYTTTVLSALESTAVGTTAAASATQHTTTTTTQTDLFTQAAVVLYTRIAGTMVVTTGGTVDVQVAQNTSNASDTVALLGGYAEFIRIA